jgi:hypothetical protein
MLLMFLVFLNVFTNVYGSFDNPQILLSAKMDKINYMKNEKAIIDILDLPSSNLTLRVIDSNSREKFSETLKMSQEGHQTYSLNLAKYENGVYKLIINDGNNKIELGFSVGLFPTGTTIVIMPDKTEYVDGIDNTVLIFGYGKANSTLNVSLIDMKGHVAESIVASPDHNGTFLISVPMPSAPLSGIWKITADDRNQKVTTEIKIISKISSESETQITKRTNAPLIQYESGIKIKDIQCKKSLELLVKSSDGYPICVKPETKGILIERGWAKPV